MVGGKVIGISRLNGETLVNVEDKRGQTCAVRVVEKRIKDGHFVAINVGDEVWWQCGRVMWTPRPGIADGKCGSDFDIQLPKVGYSH